jgi:hypothetical protein
MKTTKEFLRELALRNPRDDGRPASDYGLAKLLDVTPTTIGKYQNHGGTFDDAVALRAAALLNEKPLYMLACMNHERTKNAETKKVWASVAVLVLVAIGVIFNDGGALQDALTLAALSPAEASAATFNIMLNTVMPRETETRPAFQGCLLAPYSPI